MYAGRKTGARRDHVLYCRGGGWIKRERTMEEERVRLSVGFEERTRKQSMREYRTCREHGEAALTKLRRPVHPLILNLPPHSCRSHRAYSRQTLAYIELRRCKGFVW